MQRNVTEFMQQREPKVVEPVVAQRQRKHGPGGSRMKRVAIHGHAWQSALDDHADADAAYRSQCSLRSVVTHAELSELTNEVGIEVGRPELLARRLLSRAVQDVCDPRHGRDLVDQ